MSNSEITRNNLLLVAKSGKRKSNRDGNSYYRWYTFFDEKANQMISIPGRLDLKISIFGIATVSYKTEKRSNWNMQYDTFILENMIAVKKLPDKRPDQFLEGELPVKLTCFGLTDAYQTDKLQIEFNELYRWRDIQFYDGYIRTENPELVLREDFFPERPIFMGYFNNINKGNNPITGGFEISGKLEVGMVKNDDGWSVGYKFGRNSKLELISYELKDLERARRVAIHDQAYADLVAWAKNRLNRDKILNPDEIDAKAEKLGLTGISPDALIEEVCMKPEYKKEFFDFIKGLGIKTYATKDGFFTVLNNRKIIWEMPKYGASTYVFDKQDPHLLMQRLKITQRAKIYSDETVAKELKFIGRRRHPESEENGEYTENWKNDVKKFAGLD